jgi:hypothetical protein
LLPEEAIQQSNLHRGYYVALAIVNTRHSLPLSLLDPHTPLVAHPIAILGYRIPMADTSLALGCPDNYSSGFEPAPGTL